MQWDIRFNPQKSQSACFGGNSPRDNIITLGDIYLSWSAQIEYLGCCLRGKQCAVDSSIFIGRFYGTFNMHSTRTDWAPTALVSLRPSKSCLRTMLGIEWHQFARNDEVRRITKQSNRTAIIWTYCAYVWWRRCQNDSNGFPPDNCKRPPGHPRITCQNMFESVIFCCILCMWRIISLPLSSVHSSVHVLRTSVNCGVPGQVKMTSCGDGWHGHRAVCPTWMPVARPGRIIVPARVMICCYAPPRIRMGPQITSLWRLSRHKCETSRIKNKVDCIGPYHALLFI